jgi:hypothetical protein
MGQSEIDWDSSGPLKFVSICLRTVICNGTRRIDEGAMQPCGLPHLLAPELRVITALTTR